MYARRKLTLRTERLTELTGAELRDLAAAQATPLCVSEWLDACHSMRHIESLCRCFTEYCSIDVC